MLQVVFPIGVFECFFLATLVFFKGKRASADNILTGLFLLVGLNILAGSLEFYNRNIGYAHSWMVNISSPWVMLHGPVLWAYCNALTKPAFKLRLPHVLHLMPFAIILGRHYVSTYSKSAADKIKLAQGLITIDPAVFNFFLSFMIIVVFAYIIWCIAILREHETTIESFFSNTDKINLRWLKFLLYGALITYTVAYGIIVLNKLYPFTSYKNTESIGYGLTSILVFILGFYGLKQTMIFNTVDLSGYARFQALATSAPRYDLRDQIVTRINNVMEARTPHLDHNLTLRKLADLCDLTESELSNTLNNQLHRNFFDFVNQYRVEAFKHAVILPENQNLTLLGIATNCGFSSKATFNRVFKNVTGYTPKDYKAKLESETTFPGK